MKPWMKKLLLATALAAGTMIYATAPSASPLTDDGPLQVFMQFVIYTEVCDVDPSIIDGATFQMMTSLAAQRTQAHRELIGQHAVIEVKALIAAAGLPRFCAVYGSEMTPKIRALNEAARRFLGR